MTNESSTTAAASDYSMTAEPSVPTQRKAASNIIAGMSTALQSMGLRPHDPEKNPLFYREALNAAEKGLRALQLKTQYESSVRELKRQIHDLIVEIEDSVSDLKTLAAQERAVKKLISESDAIKAKESEMSKLQNLIGDLEVEVTRQRWSKDINIAHMHELSGWYNLRAAIKDSDTAQVSAENNRKFLHSLKRRNREGDAKSKTVMTLEQF
jgi:hypothetical protein